ncbi:beta strand repeat-containing protein [Hymenobacter sp. BRD67]|uniref:beta strand repeat-containing protein n=1 Tax=Hymenobacter sp. BRD67 TaxID=2675877 RepID=UPI001566C006|nr:Ig-like domain-containing protein [Hymenobacter sp. BRD67]QKG53179.1 hypothetical protein GKZ67_11965 [Hymenobacter sp. BRD67]
MSDNAYGIAVNGTNVYVTGVFASGSSASISGTSLAGAGGVDMFVAKYIDNGSGLTNGGALSGGGSGDDFDGQGGIAVNNGTVVATGSFVAGTSAVISGTTLSGSGSGNNDVFVAKYTDSGSGLANSGAVSGGGSDLDSGFGIAISGGQAMVGGVMVAPATFGSTTLSNGVGFIGQVSVLPPTLTSLNPTSGPIGTSVTLTGTNFTGATGVSFNGTAATTFSVTNVTTATATVPAGATTGNVTITTGGGTSNGVTFTVNTPATVTTAAATSITTTSAVLGGNVTSDGGAAVTDRGVVYSTTNTTPTTSDTKVANGSGTGTFSATISGLTPGTTYYVRAYAINTVGTSYGTTSSFTTTPNAPVVTAPANGGFSTTTTPTYSGTSQVNSTVTVYVDGSSIGTTTASAGGNFSLTQPTALAQGGHTVRATATVNGSTSVNSNTNTFTVDSVPPTVAISSSAGASGSSTTTSPIPFTVTFSENVTGFVAGDVTVSNGSVGTVSGSGTTYTFNVTPTTAGLVTVNVPANVAQDAAGNGNTAAPSTYSITYVVPTATVVSVTRLTPSPTATTTVNYRVVFSASVTGVTTSNFSLTTTGAVSGASVSSVIGSGTTYTVAVNTGSGDGTLRLNVANSVGLSPTVTNVPYTAGDVYTITKSFAAAPQLTIQGTGGTGSDVTAFVDVVQVLSSGSPFANALQNTSFETHAPLANGDFGYNPTGASWTFNAQSGIANAGSAFTPTTPIPNGIAVAFVQSNGGSNGQLQQNLALPTGSSYQVSFQTAQRVCCTTLDQALNVFLNGVFIGTIQPSSNGYSTFTSATFSVTAPALTASISSTAGASGSTTGTSPIPFTVTFSQSVTGFSAAGVTVSNGSVSGFAGSGTTYTFNVTPSANGLVTVNVPAGAATDANNTPNTAASQFSITYTQPVTAAPVVSSPANGSYATTTTPTYGGTAVANSTVTVYVDGTSIGTTTASAGGNFSLTQPSALAQGGHTVRATAQSSGSAVSANSNTNTFTVDSVPRPWPSAPRPAPAAAAPRLRPFPSPSPFRRT